MYFLQVNLQLINESQKLEIPSCSWQILTPKDSLELESHFYEDISRKIKLKPNVEPHAWP